MIPQWGGSNNNKSDDYYDTRLTLPISYTTTKWVPIAVTNAMGFSNSDVETRDHFTTFTCSANNIDLSTIAVASAALSCFVADGHVLLDLLADNQTTSFFWFAIGV